MNKIKFAITVTVSTMIALAVSGCSDFLDTYPKDALSPSTTWKTEDDADKFLTGCYNDWLWGEEFFFLECASDFGFNFHEEGSGYQPTGNGTMTAAATVSFYDYTQIRRVLTFIDNVDKVTFADEAVKKDMIAQARVIRAYDYFKMNWWYGGVPIIKSFATPEEAEVPRDTEEAVKQYIYDELDAAIPDLNDAPAQAGRIAKGTALALKMRSALYYGDYQRVIDAANAIKALGIYELEPVYSDIFTLAGRSSKEIILSVQHVKPGAEEWIITVPNNGVGGWSSLVPTQNLIDRYEMKSGLTTDEAGSGYDPVHPFANRDPRMAMTVLYPGVDFADSHKGIFNTLDQKLDDGSDNPDFPTKAANSSKSALTWAKYVMPISQYDDFYSTETQYIVFRYAEVLLSLAEASNELGTAPTAEAYEALDAIRTRAGMPVVDRAKYNSKDKLRELIRRERAVEMAGEGLRRADIVRWKDADGKMLAETVLNGPLNRITGTVNYAETNPELRATVTGTAKIEDRKFVPLNRYLPIRQANLDNNKKLTQTTYNGASY